MIEINGLTAGYGDKTVLRNLSTCFESGKLISIIGPNGCGKSTLLKIIIGILKPSCGTVTIDGSDLLNMKAKEAAKKIAYLPQGNATPDMTVRQLVLHGRFPYLSYPKRYTENDRIIAAAAMNRMRIQQLANEHLSALSGGMKQNAYIAMALAQSTKYIFMDEPTTYLDISNQLELMKTLKSLAAEGKGVVSVMHDLPLAFTFSDEIAIVYDGHILFKDTPSAVARSGLIKRAFGIDIAYSGSSKSYCYMNPNA